MSIDPRQRFRGCLLGLACGDAVGTTVEFRSRGSFEPVMDMVGGGPFGLSAGSWTDDTSMALCLADSLLERGGFDARDQMGRYVNWWRWGYRSATGHCFDIGNTVATALRSFERTGEPFSGSADPHTAGNGSLMRLAPVVLFYYPELEQALRFAADSSRTTHAAPEAVECCQLLAAVLCTALGGGSREEILDQPSGHFSEKKVQALASGAYRNKLEAEISGSGYCVASLEAALWCFARSGSFEETILAATNLGEDADTTAAIAGQIAGAFYGEEGIPASWRERVLWGEEIATLGARLGEWVQ